MSSHISPPEMRKIASVLDAILKGNTKPKEVGYVLLTFDLKKLPNQMNYISNADRLDMIKALNDILNKFKTELN